MNSRTSSSALPHSASRTRSGRTLTPTRRASTPADPKDGEKGTRLEEEEQSSVNALATVQHLVERKASANLCFPFSREVGPNAKVLVVSREQ